MIGSPFYFFIPPFPPLPYHSPFHVPSRRGIQTKITTPPTKLWYELLVVFGIARPTACFPPINTGTGTGTPAKSALPSNFVLHQIDRPNAIAAVTTNSEIPNILFRTLINAFAPNGGEKKYFHFSVGDGLPDWVEAEPGVWKWGARREEDIGDLDDVAKIGLIDAKAREYISSNEAQGLVGDCVAAMKKEV